MGTVTRREWYERTNAAWPAQVPALTAEEAVRAARRLYRYATKRTWTGEVRVASGRRRTSVRRGVITVNPAQGWKEFVHELSHWIPWHTPRLREANGHNKAHAKLERRMILEVVRRGWLTGKLKDQEPEQPAAPARPDVRSKRRQLTLAGIERWEAKERRAKNALRKLRRRLAYYERELAKREVAA